MKLLLAFQNIFIPDLIFNKVYIVWFSLFIWLLNNYKNTNSIYKASVHL